MDIIEPNDDKIFNQKRFDAMSKKLDEDVKDMGINKLMRAQWEEELIKPHKYILSLEEVVERYGYVLTDEELNKIKKLINNNGKER